MHAAFRVIALATTIALIGVCFLPASHDAPARPDVSTAVPVPTAPEPAASDTVVPAAARSAGIDAQAWGSIEQQMRDHQHRVSVRDDRGDATAFNPATDVAGTFSPRGVAFRHQAGTAGRFGLELQAWGAPDAMRDVAPATGVTTEGRRVELPRGPITEWVENRDGGMMHGFTVAAPPSRGHAGELDLRLALDAGTATPRVSADGRDLHLHTTTGKRLGYTGLVAFDATGRDLAARMTLRDGDLVMRVDTTDAVYPLTIDPTVDVYGTLYTMPFRATASAPPVGTTTDRSFGGGGWSVALMGDFLLVGAPDAYNWNNLNRSGLVHVFERGGQGWTYDTTIFPNQAVNSGDDFGTNVAAYGGFVAITAPAPGYVELYEYSAGSWVYRNYGVVASGYDTPLAISATHVAIGNPSGDSGNGEVFAYKLSDFVSSGSFGAFARVAGTGGEFGASVALDGDRLVVSAPEFDGTAGSDSGRVYWYRLDGSGFFQHEYDVEGPVPNGGFGFDVDISGDRTIIGMPGYTVAGDVVGAAAIYRRQGGEWVSEALLLANDVGEFFGFGWAVAIDRHMAIVGAPNVVPIFEDESLVGFDNLAGGAWVFEAVGTTWNEVAHVVPADANLAGNGNKFGYAVDICGDDIAVGAPQADVTVEDMEQEFALASTDGGTTEPAVFGDIVTLQDAGAAYVLSRVDTDWREVGTAADGSTSSYGTTVAIDGEWMIVGEPDDRRVHFYQRSNDAWTHHSSIRDNTRPNLGFAVDISSTVAAAAATTSLHIYSFNGTNWTTSNIASSPSYSFASIAVDRRGADFTLAAGLPDTNRFFLWDGGFSTAIVNGNNVVAGDEFGASVAIDNGTILVGAPGKNADVGEVQVFTGSGTSYSHAFTMSPSASTDRFGEQVAYQNGVAAIAAPTGGPSFNGSLYVCIGAGFSWSNAQTLTVGDPNERAGLDGIDIDAGVIVMSSAYMNVDKAWILTQNPETGDFAVTNELTDNSFEKFGASCAVSGGHIAIGATGVEGDGGVTLYDYTQGASTDVVAGKFTLPNPSFADGEGSFVDEFGASVDIDGKTLIVGAPLFAEIDMSGFGQFPEFIAARSPDGDTEQIEPLPYFGSVLNIGGAFVFVDAGNNAWTLQQVLISPSPFEDEQFGYDVGVSGDNIIVGAPNPSGIGNAYIYNRTGHTWSLANTVSEGFSGDEFGFSVAIATNWAAVGAPYAGNGRVHRWFSASNDFQSLGSPDTTATSASNAEFGYAVALSDDGAMLAIGVPGEGVGGQVEIRLTSGGVYVGDFAPGDVAAGDRFGESVDIDAVGGAYAFIAGSPGKDSSRGKVYIFSDATGTFTEVAALQPADTAAGDKLGQSVAIIDGVALGGAPEHGDDGAVYVFNDDGGWSQTDKIMPFDGPGWANRVRLVGRDR
jgi:hypothetical protein